MRRIKMRMNIVALVMLIMLISIIPVFGLEDQSSQDEIQGQIDEINLKLDEEESEIWDLRINLSKLQEMKGEIKSDIYQYFNSLKGILLFIATTAIAVPIINYANLNIQYGRLKKKYKNLSNQFEKIDSRLKESEFKYKTMSKVNAVRATRRENDEDIYLFVIKAQDLFRYLYQYKNEIDMIQYRSVLYDSFENIIDYKKESIGDDKIIDNSAMESCLEMIKLASKTKKEIEQREKVELKYHAYVENNLSKTIEFFRKTHNNKLDFFHYIFDAFNNIDNETDKTLYYLLWKEFVDEFQEHSHEYYKDNTKYSIHETELKKYFTKPTSK